MASLDSLPADQRAVIQLVLQRGRSYDDIASMLSIDRAAVRQRALDGFDALGPSNSIPDPQRALITDYLLGQLPPRVAVQVRDRLASSAPERAWARVIASEAGSLSSSPLPEIPVGQSRQETPDAQDGREATPAERSAPAAVAAPVAVEEGSDRPDAARTPDDSDSGPRPTRPRPERAPSSRRGGAVILGAVAALIVVIVIVLIATGGSSPKHPRQSASTPRTTPTGTTTTSTTRAKLVTQVNLVSPTGAKNTAGVAQVISEGKTLGVVIVAQGVPANTKSNAYAVWLSNSASSSKLVGFVNQRVGSNGRLETEGPLPAGASGYKQMLVTVENQAHPKSPGTIVLEGAFHLG